MGCVCNANNSQNRDINKYMHNAEDEDAKIHKMLLLGPGSTGKSTLFESLKMVHSGGTMSDTQKNQKIHAIHSNILENITILIKRAKMLYEEDEIKFKDCQLPLDSDANLASEIELIKKEYEEQVYGIGFDTTTYSLDQSVLIKLGNSIKHIWNLDSIQATYKLRRSHFAMADNFEHFMNKIDVVMSPDYIPTEEDCLKNRSKTGGIKISL